MTTGLIDSVNQLELANSSLTQYILCQRKLQIVDTIAVTPSNNAFHKECIITCLKFVPECPTCKPNKFNLTVLPLVDPKKISQQVSPKSSSHKDITVKCRSRMVSRLIF